MAKAKWSKEKIIDRILKLYELDVDLTCTRVKETDSALVGAATKYFGSWGDAIKAAGLDYSKIRQISEARRKDKVRKWTKEKVLQEIKSVAENEKDLSNAFMKEKHPALVAAASNYFGSWKKALEKLGFDYDEVLRIGREEKTRRQKTWYRHLLLERLEKMNTLDERIIIEKSPEFHGTLIQYFSSWRNVVKELKKLQKEREDGNESSEQ